MDPSNYWFKVLFIIATIGIFCTILCLIHLFFFPRPKGTRIGLLRLLQITLLLEEISNLPIIYSGDDGLCKFIGWLRYYSGFSNLLVLFFMSFYYFSFIVIEQHSSPINRFISKYGTKIIFLLPLITLLPFSTDSYGPQDQYWCTLPLGHNNRTASAWSIIIYFFWIFIILLIVTIFFVYTLYNIITYHIDLLQKLIHSIGIYIITSLACWLPRVVLRGVHTFHSQDPSGPILVQITIPLYVSAIAYMLIYFYDVLFIEKDCIQEKDPRTGTTTERLLPRDDNVESTMRVSDLLHILDATNGSRSRGKTLTSSCSNKERDSNSSSTNNPVIEENNNFNNIHSSPVSSHYNITIVPDV